jgi:hypothetical protein
MAAVAKSGTPSPSTMIPGGNCFVGSDMKAGEAIAAGDACQITTTGKVIRSTGAAANQAARVHGFAAAAAALNEAITLLTDMDFHYGSGLTPGIPVYLSGTTAGGLDTAASTGGTAPIGFVLKDGARIRLFGSRY